MEKRRKTKSNFLHNLIAAWLFCVTIFLAYNFPSETFYPCQSTQVLIQMAMDHGFTYFATAERSDGSAVSLYINEEAEQWLLMSHDINMTSCVTDQGTNWAWAFSITPL